MLPKKQRIPRKYFGLLKKAKIVSNDLFLVRLAPSSMGISKFCFSVSKKVAKTAVLRNRFRRLGYRTIAGFIDKIKPGFLVHISFRSIPKNDFDVEKNLQDILRKSELI